jgi:tRNA threonylcarbamoyladenosine biosynthesis protein TsaB
MVQGQDRHAHILPCCGPVAPTVPCGARGKMLSMSTILAIETSTGLASAALLHEGRSNELETPGVQTHSVSILPMVQRLLADAGISLAQCDAIAFGCGPGSFTGVRTACGVAQGLAFGADLPLLPIVTLEAMAEACRDASGAIDVLTLLDARMGEVYWAQYHYQEGWQSVIAPALSAPEQVLPQGTVIACGNGLSGFPDAWIERPFAAHARPDIAPRAQYIARLAQRALAQGRGLAAHEAQPLYLRNQVALTTLERLAKGRA